MKVNPTKCSTWSYIHGDDGSNRANTNFKISNEAIPIVQLYEGIPYLGIISAIQKSFRGKIANIKIEKVKSMIMKICSSSLKITQKFDAIKRIILPKLDFEMANGYTCKKDRESLNKIIRASLNGCLPSASLPIDFFYTNWKDGGIGLKDINDRYKNLLLNTFVKLWFSEDIRIRKSFRYFCTEERENRDKDVRRNPMYLHESEILCELDKCKRGINRSGTSNLFSRIVKCFAGKMDIKLLDEICGEENRGDEGVDEYKIILNLIDVSEEQMKEIKELTTPRTNTGGKKQIEEMEVSEQSSIENSYSEGIEVGHTNDFEIKTDKSKILKVLNTIDDIKHRSGLIKLPLRGHSFKTLKGCNLSNYFMTQYKSTIPDDILSFVVMARTNSFKTGQIDRMMDKDRPNNNFVADLGKCKRCGEADSLRHRLNDCEKLRNRFKKRHDYVVKGIIDMLKEKDDGSLLFNLDCTVRDKDNNKLMGENANYKPDIWFRDRSGNMVMIEVTVPYGDVNEQGINSLDERYKQKKEKYEGLKKDIEEQWKIKVDYYVIVISSLGAWQKDSLKNLRILAGEKIRWIRYAKRLVVSAIRGSRLILLKDKESDDGTADHPITTDEETNDTSDENDNRMVNRDDDTYDGDMRDDMNGALSVDLGTQE